MNWLELSCTLSVLAAYETFVLEKNLNERNITTFYLVYSTGAFRARSESFQTIF